MELNKTHTGVGDKYGTKRFQAMCRIVYADSELYSGIWNELKNSTLLGTENCPGAISAAYDVLCRYKKLMPQRAISSSHVCITW